MKYSLLIFTMLLLASQANTQPIQQWEARYNAPGNNADYSNDVALDGQGNIYVTGYSRKASNTTDIVTIKYNSAGVQEWAATYNGPADSNDYAYKLAVDNQGNVYVAGDSWGIGTQADFTVIKYNSAGIQQWVKRLNGAYNNIDRAQDITLDGQGNIYAAGFIHNGSPTYSIYMTVKYNSAGDELWSKTYNGPGLTDEAKRIVLDAAGNVIVTGKSGNGPSNNSPDYLTVKYNSSGAEQWAARTGISYHNEDVSELAVDASGNIYITGTEDRGVDSTNYLTVKYNSAGVQQWTHKFLGEDGNPDVGKDIELDASGNVYVTGKSIKAGEEDNTGTIKYNTNGVVQWVAYYRGYHQTIINRDQYPGEIKVDADGNVYVCGYDYSHAYISKYNSSGVQQWYKLYGPTVGDDTFNALELDAGNNIFVTGPSYGGTTPGFDYATVKYSQPIGIDPISAEVPDKFLLSQNYPNPFNPVTNIEFSIPSSEFVKLTVNDITGKEIAVLVNEQLSAGTYRADWDASKYSSGVYFYKLITDNFTSVKKMILVK